MRTEACLGGGLEHPLGICERGYGGVICAKCIQGHFRSGSFECSECPSPIANMFVFVGGLLLLLVFVVILVRAALQASALKKPLYAVYLKIFLNHYQLLQVIAAIDFGWPD